MARINQVQTREADVKNIPGQEPKGTVIITHGLKGSKNEPHIKAFASASVNAGFDALAFDCKQSAYGDTENATVTSAIRDLLEIIDGTSHAKPIILAGHSMGALASLEVANMRKDIVKGLCLTGTCVSGELSATAINPDELERWKGAGYREETIKETGRVFHLPWTHMIDRMEYDTLKYASDLNIPVLMFAGKDDVVCPVHHQKYLVASLKNCEFHIFEGAGHTFREQRHLDDLKAIFEEWLNAQRYDVVISTFVNQYINELRVVDHR